MQGYNKAKQNAALLPLDGGPLHGPHTEKSTYFQAQEKLQYMKLITEYFEQATLEESPWKYFLLLQMKVPDILSMIYIKANTPRKAPPHQKQNTVWHSQCNLCFYHGLTAENSLNNSTLTSKRYTQNNTLKLHKHHIKDYKYILIAQVQPAHSWKSLWMQFGHPFHHTANISKLEMLNAAYSPALCISLEQSTVCQGWITPH